LINIRTILGLRPSDIFQYFDIVSSGLSNVKVVHCLGIFTFFDEDVKIVIVNYGQVFARLKLFVLELIDVNQLVTIINFQAEIFDDHFF